MAKQFPIAFAFGGQIKAGDYHMHGFTVVKVDMLLVVRETLRLCNLRFEQMAPAVSILNACST